MGPWVMRRAGEVRDGRGHDDERGAGKHAGSLRRTRTTAEQGNCPLTRSASARKATTRSVCADMSGDPREQTRVGHGQRGGWRQECRARTALELATMHFSN